MCFQHFINEGISTREIHKMSDPLALTPSPCDISDDSLVQITCKTSAAVPFF
jgi:hypothetical protein